MLQEAASFHILSRLFFIGALGSENREGPLTGHVVHPTWAVLWAINGLGRNSDFQGRNRTADASLFRTGGEHLYLRMPCDVLRGFERFTIICRALLRWSESGDRIQNRLSFLPCAGSIGNWLPFCYNCKYYTSKQQADGE